VSPGQLALDPVQVSATSHSPPEARQLVEPDAKASVGHELPLPLQVSAVSQMPAEVRQT